MLIVMAGLPATGKSALAGRLARELDAVVLNKDLVRAVLFPSPVLDSSTAQDDLCMTAIHQAATLILKTFPKQTVILDGRMPHACLLELFKDGGIGTLIRAG